ncbi:MAG: hypothetical protein FWC72_06265 [Oscillospiraceae bacterium]|nr:hypothetical protein [Oscillospiraceae bacterium]
MELFQTLLTVLMGLAVLMYFVMAGYKRKKQVEYGNDERWKSIVAAVMRVLYHYHAVVLALVVLANFVYRLLAVDIQIRLNDVFGLLFLILLGASAVEFVAFQVYDRKM